MDNKLKKLRQERGLSQEELSAKAGVSRTIISGLESGRVNQTTIGTLRKLAKELNVELAFFFELLA